MLCDPQSPESFSAAIEHLLNNPAQLVAMRAASASRAQLFDATDMINAYEQVLMEAAAARGHQWPG
jgi:glycosyltransferase involved in cell wall biosynthesis